jgi:hypothetical protein
MRIGRLEIRWIKPPHPVVTDSIDRTGVFAVPDTEPWWIAVHQAINDCEKETIREARAKTINPNACIAAVGAGEGCDFVRLRLTELREIALSDIKKQQQLRAG